jgi:ribonuclease P protein component
VASGFLGSPKPWAKAAAGLQAEVSRMQTFRRNEHIRRRVEYQQIYDRGVRTHGRFLTMFTLSNNLPIGRLGIAASRKLGGAIVRNRAKRLIREVFRRNKLAPGFDIVVIPKRELLDASLTTLETEFRNTLERSLRRRK